jgi:hypothetical protein
MKMPDLQRLGVPGVLGLSLMLFNFSFYLGSIAPDQEGLAILKQQRSALLEDSPSARGRVADAASSAPSILRPPSLNQIPELLRSVFSLAAQHGVVIDRATYSLSEKDGPPRIELDLPLQASYPILRSFLADVDRLKPAPAIDELTIKRRQASDAMIDATLRLSWSLAPAS